MAQATHAVCAVCRPSENAAVAAVGRAFMPDKHRQQKNVGHKCPTYGKRYYVVPNLL
ncbi:hypothetical protein HMPREF9123_2594 [Neisseria bacilliformis ATCC BAA-1200]|uniref:Uncharacterized protein n=1 Tax=Neisseria bacilliformis ATCC BAA-1200 TaxID=888742 RepID=F2BFT7_9NEIS|nr:hypothetical protein HMPREF9123_2594 [Neisseria bacilliformis ATCC BAA-1200]